MRERRIHVVAPAHIHDSGDAYSGGTSLHNGHPYAVADGLAAQLRVRLPSWQGGLGSAGFRRGYRARVAAGYDDASAPVHEASCQRFSRHPGTHSTISDSGWLIFGCRPRRRACFIGGVVSEGSGTRSPAVNPSHASRFSRHIGVRLGSGRGSIPTSLPSGLWRRPTGLGFANSTAHAVCITGGIAGAAPVTSRTMACLVQSVVVLRNMNTTKASKRRNNSSFKGSRGSRRLNGKISSR